MPGDTPSSHRPLILIDEDVEGDRRVAQSIVALPGAEIRDIRTGGLTGAVSVLCAGWLMLAGLCSAPLARRRRIASLLGGMVRHRSFDGLAAVWTWTYRAVCAARSLRHTTEIIHAHDLYCGLAAVMAMPRGQGRLIYNAHELEIHRNRRAGWFRILIEHYFEQRVLHRADEVIVVNQAIADALRGLYPESRPSVRIAHNDFYPYHPVPHPDTAQRPAIVYVGKGVRGRQLERLDRPEKDVGFSVHGYFLGQVLPAGLSGCYWQSGPVEYEADLLSLVQSRRCLMWCCLDAHVLSYKLALPNKFFQALAVGIPVIASPGTYLAEIVERYRLGVVLEGDVAALVPRVRSAEFENWTAAVAAFREAFRKGAIVI
jgi:glycosyltransferase involved in cell wall biosynthesis